MGHNACWELDSDYPWPWARQGGERFYLRGGGLTVLAVEQLSQVLTANNEFTWTKATVRAPNGDQGFRT